MQVQSKINQGFTLLELLVVLVLMAIVAGVAVLAYEDTNVQAELDATKYEMAELRKALLQFRRDTGVFPSQGEYTCQVPPSSFFYPSHVNANHVDWCNSPANFWMLFLNPLDDSTTTTIEEGGWNPDTKRGWNGPYLSRSGPAYVNWPKISPIIEEIRGVADAFTIADKLWRVAPDEALIANGSPYLIFDLGDEDKARIVSVGPDGNDGGINPSDSCVPNFSDVNGKDDLVFCLLK